MSADAAQPLAEIQGGGAGQLGRRSATSSAVLGHLISIRRGRVACHAERSEASLPHQNERFFASAAAFARDDMTVLHVELV